MILRPSPSRSSSTNPPQPVLSALFERGGGAGAGANQRDGAGGEAGGKGGGGGRGGVVVRRIWGWSYQGGLVIVHSNPFLEIFFPLCSLFASSFLSLLLVLSLLLSVLLPLSISLSLSIYLSIYLSIPSKYLYLYIYLSVRHFVHWTLKLLAKRLTLLKGLSFLFTQS